MTEHDFAAIAATDELLDALANGNRTTATNGESDAMTSLLAQWRHELDDHAASLAPFDGELSSAGVSPARSSQRWARAHRRTAAAAALAVALAASTGVAAAESGRSGPLAPLNRLLFGGTAQHHDATPSRVSALLQQAGDRIDVASEAGGISAAGRNDISALLNRAAGLLAADADAPAAVADRLATLRTQLSALAQLPTSPSAPVTAGGTDNAGTGDHGGHGQGSDDSATNGADHHGGSTGSDDANSSGTSGDGSTDGGGIPGSTSGPTDGSSGGSGTTDGSSGGSGTTDGSSGGSGSTDGGSIGSGSGGGSDDGSRSVGSDGLVGADGDSSGQTG
jgi:hypothetical protein